MEGLQHGIRVIFDSWWRLLSSPVAAEWVLKNHRAPSASLAASIPLFRSIQVVWTAWARVLAGEKIVRKSYWLSVHSYQHPAVEAPGAAFMKRQGAQKRARMWLREEAICLENRGMQRQVAPEKLVLSSISWYGGWDRCLWGAQYHLQPGKESKECCFFLGNPALVSLP